MRRLNFHHLHYFWAVAKEGNLTRAARICVDSADWARPAGLLSGERGQSERDL